MLLKNIALFLQIVEKGSLTAAAREAGLSATTVSERLAALEAHYGVVLLNRTTRSVRLTEEGRVLVEGARGVLETVDELDARIRMGAQMLSGPIRVSAPNDLGRNAVAGAISSFLKEHPDISIDLLLSDGYVDVVGEGIDIALRFGQIGDSTLRKRSLGEFRRLVCAAPDYLARWGTPGVPADLSDHNCLVMRFGAHLDNQWSFGQGAAQQLVTVKGDRVANDGALVRQWGVEGHGIILKSALDVQADICDGNLVEILVPYAPPPTPLQMLFPPGRTQPRRIRAFASHLEKMVRQSSDQIA